MGTKEIMMKSVIALCLVASAMAMDLSELCTSVKHMDHSDPVHLAAAKLCKDSFDVALLQVGDDNKLPNGTLVDGDLLVKTKMVVGDVTIDGTTNTISTKENDLVLSPATA